MTDIINEFLNKHGSKIDKDAIYELIDDLEDFYKSIVAVNLDVKYLSDFIETNCELTRSESENCAIIKLNKTESVKCLDDLSGAIISWTKGRLPY